MSDGFRRYLSVHQGFDEGLFSTKLGPSRGQIGQARSPRMGAAALGFAGPQTCARLKFDLLRDAKRSINLDPEITHGALDLSMAKQKLDRSKVSGFAVD